jgi:hypothetical protein
MTEQEWLTGIDPHIMVGWVSCLAGEVPYARPQTAFSDRKFRLFACACCRQVWDKLEPAAKAAVEAAERAADSAEIGFLALYSNELYDNAWAEACRDATSLSGHSARWVACWTVEDDRFGYDRRAAVIRTADAICSAAWLRNVGIDQCGLLRDIFGNPFRPTCRLADIKLMANRTEQASKIMTEWHRGETDVLHEEWCTATVLSIAQSIYDSRDFSAMTILADALEEAGCNNNDILTHCRCGVIEHVYRDCTLFEAVGPHVRGCWVLDLILEKL